MGQKTTGKTIFFHYRFTFADGRTQEFNVELEKSTLHMIVKERKVFPDWTKLSFSQCPNCPLNEAEHPRCPVAANLVDVIDFAKDAVSYEEVDVEITSEPRSYQKHTSLQNGLSSLMGIYMVTSGCPILDRLKPMINSHLPFATLEENTFRSIATYLMAQFFLWKKGGKPDWELKGLVKMYEEIQQINQSFWKRISSVHIQDAGVNAIARLDCYARFTNMLLLDTDLAEMERLFTVYFEKSDPKR